MSRKEDGFVISIYNDEQEEEEYENECTGVHSFHYIISDVRVVNPYYNKSGSGENLH